MLSGTLTMSIWTAALVGSNKCWIALSAYWYKVP